MPNPVKARTFRERREYYRGHRFERWEDIVRNRLWKHAASTKHAAAAERVAENDSPVERSYAEHTCVRPSWECRACGSPWPCAPAKESLADGADRVMLMMYLWGHLDHAVTELPARPPAEMFDRFLSWTDAELVQA